MTQVCCMQDPFLLSLIVLFPSLIIIFSRFLLVTNNNWCSLAEFYKTLCHRSSEVEFFKFFATSTGIYSSHPSLLTFWPHHTSQNLSHNECTTNLSAVGTLRFFSSIFSSFILSKLGLPHQWKCTHPRASDCDRPVFVKGCQWITAWWQSRQWSWVEYLRSGGRTRWRGA
jgi:hypothetical protein